MVRSSGTKPKPIKNIQGVVFPSVGRCIYCGSDGGEDGLRREHVIPYSLGGNAEILGASCKSCEGKTSYIDGYLANSTFDHFRIHARIQTRRPKDRPAKLPARIAVGGTQRTVEMPIADHPHFVVLPALPLPGILRGAEPFDPLPKDLKAWSYHALPDNLADTLGLRPGERAQVRSAGKINISAFARAIAKVAHCHAVIQFGIDGFYPILPDLIRGLHPHFPYFVGSPENATPPPIEGALHRVTFEKWKRGRVNLIVCSVRLFANSGTPEHGMPIYLAVVGTRRRRAAAPQKSTPRKTTVRAHSSASASKRQGSGQGAPSSDGASRQRAKSPRP